LVEKRPVKADSLGRRSVSWFRGRLHEDTVVSSHRDDEGKKDLMTKA